MAVSDLLQRPATELARLVRSGELTSRELVEASLERIEALDGRVNAFCHLHADEALGAADAIGPGDPRPFAGVPIAMKTEIPVAGSPLTMGSRLFGDFTPAHDAFAARRLLRDAGCVMVGRTSMPELGIMPVTEPTRFGPTRNPWDLERTPGGSSGGSAAAVAAGMVPIAHAADGGGSIRIPAACCGLVGLKPTRGRVSIGPDLGDHPLVTHGTVTRTVAETAAMLDVLAGYEPGDATWAPPPGEPFAAAASREPRRLKIAVTTLPPLDVPVDPACARVVREAAEALASLGHEVVEADPAWQIEGFDEIFLTVFGAYISQTVAIGGILSGQAPSRENLEPLTLAIFERAQETSALQVLGANTRLQAFSRGLIAGFFGEHDVLVTPALVRPAVPVGTYDTAAPDAYGEWARSGEFACFTPGANISGQPAISLPLGETDEGLPLAVQIIGRPADEATLLALGAQLEQARPWDARRADLAG